MKLPHRRHVLHLAAGAAALSAVSRIALAQAYPTRPVRIIGGAPAGGGIDIVARLMGQWLSERLGQQFIVENRPGAGTNIATEAVVRAAPDGYTLSNHANGNRRDRQGRLVTCEHETRRVTRTEYDGTITVPSIRGAAISGCASRSKADGAPAREMSTP
jgi:hypothetical protein